MKIAMALMAMIGGLSWWMLMGESNYEDTVIAHFPVDDGTDFATAIEEPLAIDYEISSDGNGSLRIDSDTSSFFNLYRLWGNEEDLSFRQLVYQAKVRTRGTESPVLLLMQANITSVPGGQIPVIGRDTAISGDNDWTTMEIAAGNGAGTRFLGATLQLQMDGPGTVWIDDIKLLSRQFY